MVALANVRSGKRNDDVGTVRAALVEVGMRILAVRSGSIIRSGRDLGSGRFLVLRVGGFGFFCCHLCEQTVTSGPVKAGQKIGEAGRTGKATGPHLHFEKRPAGGGLKTNVAPDW